MTVRDVGNWAEPLQVPARASSGSNNSSPSHHILAERPPPQRLMAWTNSNETGEPRDGIGGCHACWRLHSIPAWYRAPTTIWPTCALRADPTVRVERHLPTAVSGLVPDLELSRCSHSRLRFAKCPACKSREDRVESLLALNSTTATSCRVDP